MKHASLVIIVCIICMIILAFFDVHKSSPQINDHTNDEHGKIISIGHQTNLDYIIGDYIVDIGNAFVCNCHGKDYILIKITWTNNSSNTTSFKLHLKTRAYQNDNELKAVYKIKDCEYNLDDVLKFVKPGESYTVTKAFILNDLSTSVEVEVSCANINDKVIHKVFDF